MSEESLHPGIVVMKCLKKSFRTTAPTALALVALLTCSECAAMETDPMRTSSTIDMSRPDNNDFMDFFREITDGISAADQNEHSMSAQEITTAIVDSARTFPAVSQEGSLRMTYNDTKQIYEFPHHLYLIWFKPLTRNTTIRLQFDFSIYAEGSDFRFTNYSHFHYLTKPGVWHKLQLLMKDHSKPSCLLPELRISRIEVSECLPHPNIARIQVSSNDGLVLWSQYLPQGQWWNEIVEVQSSSAPILTTIMLAVCLVIVLISLFIVGTIACQLRQKLRRRELKKEDPLYAEWKDIQPNRAKYVPSQPVDSGNCESNGHCTTNTVLT